ncbi:MAG: hypothetical protein Q9160_002343 [Pyrenula sp. 1 TL-2023]
MGKKMPVIIDNLFRKTRQPSESPSSSPYDDTRLFSDEYQKYRDQEDVEGIIKSISLLVGAAAAFFPDYLDGVLDSWGEAGGPTGTYSHWPTDFSRDIQPVPCHSHNDYWRRVPLFSALKAGCTGVEADVWLYDDELFVGHTTSSLTPDRTLRSLYVDPLIDILTKQNPLNYFHPQSSSPSAGVFDTDPAQSLVLLIDFKTSGHDLWPVVVSQLEPLRSKGYLSYYNGKDVVQGPITIVATGNAPFDLLTANTTYRDIFFDAPLDLMTDPSSDPSSPISTQDPAPVSPSSTQTRSSSHGGQGHTALPSDLSTAFNPTNSYYASVSFKKSIGLLIPLPWTRRSSSLSDEQLQLIRDQIRGAHARGLKVRYWGTPSWPRGLRDYVWRLLIEEGVDMLNVDDLTAATGRGRKGAGWW